MCQLSHEMAFLAKAFASDLTKNKAESEEKFLHERHVV